jgi:hypothetical protein
VSTYYQAHDVTNTEYVEHFKALVGVVKMYGGAYGREPGFVATELVAQGVRPEDVDSASGYNHQSRRSRPRVLPLVHVAPWSRQARSEE